MIIANAANGAISIIRLSGSGVIELLKDCIYINDKKCLFHDRELKERHYSLSDYAFLQKGMLQKSRFKGGEVEDSVMVVYFEAPKSYTGEDMVEIHAHGGSGITSLIIKYFIEKGVRLAENGEFTKRAFLNGKLDLSEAEGVLALINSGTQVQVQNAYKLHSGVLKDKIDKVLIELKEIIAKMSAAIDYPEEGVEEDTITEVEKKLKNILDEINKLKDSFSEGDIIKNGVDVVLTGDVNVGKSLILNALVGNDSAIVTDIAGTTRDIIKDSYQYKGYKFNIFDTAGIRESEDIVEKIGIEKAKNIIEQADIVLNVIDITAKNKQPKTNSQNTILVENKMDLVNDSTDDHQPATNHHIKISALKNINIDALKEKIYNKSINFTHNDIVLTEKRHYDCVFRCNEALKNAIKNIKTNSTDLVYSDLMVSYQSIAEITGIIVTDEIIDEVFSKFCVGK